MWVPGDQLSECWSVSLSDGSWIEFLLTQSPSHRVSAATRDPRAPRSSSRAIESSGHTRSPIHHQVIQLCLLLLQRLHVFLLPYIITESLVKIQSSTATVATSTPTPKNLKYAARLAILHNSRETARTVMSTRPDTAITLLVICWPPANRERCAPQRCHSRLPEQPGYINPPRIGASNRGMQR
jgi:hypothetical protein